MQAAEETAHSPAVCAGGWVLSSDRRT